MVVWDVVILGDISNYTVLDLSYIASQQMSIQPASIIGMVDFALVNDFPGSISSEQ